VAVHSLLPNPLNILFFVMVALVQEAEENSLWEVNILCHLNTRIKNINPSPTHTHTRLSLNWPPYYKKT